MSDPTTSPAAAGVAPLTLSTALRDEIIAHARDEWPRECCGLLAGPAGAPAHLYRLRNVAPGNKLYEIDPAQLYELEFRELPARGWEVVAIYHSHPSSPAYPSATDVSLAFWPEAYYVICSLAEVDRPDVRAFRIIDEQIHEATIRAE
jgi:proteasome lid subunit RPN8/RPN11